MKFPYRFKVNSTTTGTTDPLVLGSAVTKFLGTSILVDGEKYEYELEDANGTGWEYGIGTYTASGTTLSRGVVFSTNSNNKLSLTAGTHTLFAPATALQAERSYLGTSGAIQGLELAYNSTTVIRVKAGKASVNNKMVSFAQTDYTSASTMKDVANSTVTLGASKCYWVFISDAGVIGIEINDGTGDGAVPTFDTEFDYWKAASSGVSWRRIGKFYTNGSSQIIKFTIVNAGRIRKLHVEASLILVNAVSVGTTWTVLPITPYVTADDIEFDLWCQVNVGVSGTLGSVDFSRDGGTTQASDTTLLAAAAFVNGNGIAVAAPSNMPAVATHYSSQLSADGAVTIKLRAVRQFV